MKIKVRVTRPWEKMWPAWQRLGITVCLYWIWHYVVLLTKYSMFLYFKSCRLSSRWDLINAAPIHFQCWGVDSKLYCNWLILSHASDILLTALAPILLCCIEPERSSWYKISDPMLLKMKYLPYYGMKKIGIGWKVNLLWTTETVSQVPTSDGVEPSYE